MADKRVRMLRSLVRSLDPPTAKQVFLEGETYHVQEELADEWLTANPPIAVDPDSESKEG